MTLSSEDRKRLSDIVERQPTKNKELQEAWGMESGSEVHAYLESALRSYYYRDEDSLIRATAEAEALVEGRDPPETLQVSLTDLERSIYEVVPGPEEQSASVVSVLHRVESASDLDPTVGEVRRALGTLARKGVLTKISRTVPTYRLARPRDKIELESSEPA
ncbi:MAG: DUF5797 family protein [Halodesulfurarchaeum sp.]